jgi:hypothetical protein
MPRGPPYTSNEKDLIKSMATVMRAPERTDGSCNTYAKQIVAVMRTMPETIHARRDAHIATPRSLSWINTHRKKLVEYMRSTIGKNTFIVRLSALAALAKSLKMDAAYQYYSDLSTRHGKERDEASLDQGTSEKQDRNWEGLERVQEHFKNGALQRFYDLCEAREALIERRHELGRNTPPLKRGQQLIVTRAVCGWFACMMPPSRMAFATMRVTNKPLRQSDLKHGNDNYIYLPTNTNKNAVFYINSDKVSQHMGPDHWELDADTTKFVRKTLEVWPREKLVDIKSGEKHIHTSRLNIAKALSPPGKSIGMQMIRAIYITHAYADAAIVPLKEKVELARKMRHSPEIAERVYLKIRKAIINAEKDILEKDDDSLLSDAGD